MQQITNDYQDTISKFLQLLSNFSAQQINSQPVYGGWTPGQVADHVSRAQWDMPAILKGNSQHTDRASDVKYPEIEKLFLHFDTKLTSPEIILPGDGPYDKITIINSISNRSAEITDAFLSSNPSMECLDFEIPGFGKFTPLEWMYFMICHTKRHIWQLEKMVGKV